MKNNLYSFDVRLAGLDIKIETKYEYTKKLFEKYFCERVENPDIFVEFSEEDLLRECKNAPNYPEFYHESLCVYRKLCMKIIDFDAMLLHSSALMLDGEAYLFTAPSGTGKSTHTRLWREYFGDRVTMINDDKPIIRKKDGVFYVCGTPYRGQHELGENVSAPIKAICIIGRGKENIIKRVAHGDAIAPLLNQTLMPSDEILMDKLLSTFEELLCSVPVYKLNCNISEEAVRVAYECMKN